MPSAVQPIALRRKRGNQESIRHYRGHNLKGKLTAAAAALLISSAHIIAQTQTARLVGTVHDASGAAIPNAKVIATHEETKQTTEASTNTSGEYVLPSLQPGTYTLTVESSGFRKAAVKALQLDAASNMSQDVTLEVG